jgi:methanogenic corrinoid protein MtbC1
MVKEDALARYLEALLQGDRKACRSVVEETLQSGIPANSVYLHLIWPVMAEIERLQRTDRITSVHCRSTAEQVAPPPRQAQEGRRMLRS